MKTNFIFTEQDAVMLHAAGYELTRYPSHWEDIGDVEN